MAKDKDCDHHKRCDICEVIKVTEQQFCDVCKKETCALYELVKGDWICSLCLNKEVSEFSEEVTGKIKISDYFWRKQRGD